MNGHHCHRVSVSHVSKAERLRKRKQNGTRISLRRVLKTLGSPAPPNNDLALTLLCYRRCPTSISVVADCAGLMTESMALENLRIKHHVDCFAESNQALRKFLQHANPQALCVPDIIERDDNVTVIAPPPDLYVFGAPCQPWSPAGKQEGNKDKLKRNLVLWKCISHIRSTLPRTIIMENSHSLAFKKFRKVRHKIISFIKSYGYEVHWKILNTKNYGIPQNRRRFYLVGIKNEAVKRRFCFPKKMPCLDLNELLNSACHHDRRRPGCPDTERAHFVLEGCLEKLKCKKNVTPCDDTPCVVDVHSSARFASAMASCSPALTASRCVQNGHYIASRNGLMFLEEMCRLQGIHPLKVDNIVSFIAQEFGAAKALTVAKHAIGNAMSVNILMCILPRLLSSSGLISSSAPTSLANIIESIGLRS